jgi:hypothetical protein
VQRPCDICNTAIYKKSESRFYDQNRVVTSPFYWEYVISNTLERDCRGDTMQQKERILALLLTKFCDDTGGFTVCSKCQDMLEKDLQRAKEFNLPNLEKYVISDHTGRVDSGTAGVIAGAVWTKIHGNWPSSIVISDLEPHRASELSNEDKQTQKARKKFLGIF